VACTPELTTMSTPTDYTLVYPNPCEAESSCGDIDCDGPRVNPRTQVFCEDVTIQGTLTVDTVPVIVAGQAYKPTVILGLDGPHLVLAVY